MEDPVRGEREVRAAENQSLFRAVNERLQSLAETFQFITETASFACECADQACIAQLALTMDEYEAIRANATHFAVLPGHVYLDVEDVVAERGAYVVVAKRNAGAELAKKVDPRAEAASR